VEAAAHCGEISTNVLVTEVVQVIQSIRPVPVPAAGGIIAGRQMPAAMTLGAQGVWSGSVWLPTMDSDVVPVVKERLLAARSGDTMRSRALSGKPARQLKSAWSQAWESTQSPGCLPMPFEALLSEASQALALRSVEAGNSQASKLLTEGGGQGVGMLNTIKSAGAAVQEFKQDFADSVERLQTIVG
jgi:NAD(P)H-dependent flavin oxidoreductase YrpB (nitropropane dioxygenase family)